MTINKDKFKVIKTSILQNKTLTKKAHDNTTMALLKKLLQDKGMNQMDLARELGRDKTTVSRWSNDSREITWENAVQIANVLNIHPVEIYEPMKEITLRYYVNAKFEVKKYDVLSKIRIPYEYYNPDIRALRIDIPASPIDGEVHLFDICKAKPFSSFAINRMCYCIGSKIWEKKHKKKAKDVYGVLKSNADYSLSVINPFTNEPINEKNVSLSPEDILIAAPVKCKYNPLMLGKKV